MRIKAENLTTEHAGMVVTFMTEQGEASDLLAEADPTLFGDEQLVVVMFTSARPILTVPFGTVVTVTKAPEPDPDEGTQPLD